MKNAIYDTMLSVYEQSTELQRRNAIFEVNQQGYPFRALQRRLL